jgi:hypothetical protein
MRSRSRAKAFSPQRSGSFPFHMFFATLLVTTLLFTTIKEKATCAALNQVCDDSEEHRC